MNCIALCENTCNSIKPTRKRYKNTSVWKSILVTLSFSTKAPSPRRAVQLSPEVVVSTGIPIYSLCRLTCFWRGFKPHVRKYVFYYPKWWRAFHASNTVSFLCIFFDRLHLRLCFRHALPNFTRKFHSGINRTPASRSWCPTQLHFIRSGDTICFEIVCWIEVEN